MALPPTTLAIVAVALVFDYSNGFHDAANSIATVVSTRVLSPRLAVIWAAFFNFVAFAIFGVKVAQTIGKLGGFPMGGYLDETGSRIALWAGGLVVVFAGVTARRGGQAPTVRTLSAFGMTLRDDCTAEGYLL